MWNSTSRVTEGGTIYKYPELDAIINFIGCAIEREEDTNDAPLKKDDECELHNTPYLNGITNGEYIYLIFEILTEMTGDEPFKEAPYYKEAVLASLLDGLREEFLDHLNLDDYPISEAAEDIWNLYATCCRNRKAPLWTDDKDRETTPPPPSEIEADNWEWITDVIFNEFLWDRDWEIDLLAGKNFALVKEQPHFPTLQEFRTARTWIMDAYSNTRQNTKAASKR